MSVQAEVVEPQVSYRMALPSAWVRLPMEPTAMRTAARAWLKRRYAHRSIDETAQLRRRAEEQLVELTQRPSATTARQLLVLALDVEGVPVSASCLVSVVPRDLTEPGSLEALAQEMADGALSSTVTELGRNQGVVVVREDSVRGDRDGTSDRDLVAMAEQASGAQAGELDDDQVSELVADARRTRQVDVLLPFPDQPRTLLLSFSTTLVPLFAAMTELFTTVASTVQWRVDDDEWR